MQSDCRKHSFLGGLTPYSDSNTSSFYSKFFKEWTNINLILWFQNGKGSMIHRSFLICLKKKDHTHKALKGWGALLGAEVGMEHSWSLRDEGGSTGDGHARSLGNGRLRRSIANRSLFSEEESSVFLLCFSFCLSTSSFVLFCICKVLSDLLCSFNILVC